MKFYFRVILPLVALIAAAGCHSRQVESVKPVPFAASALASPQGTVMSHLASFETRNPHGEIALIGAPDNCLALCETMLGRDAFDNIDGTAIPDRLPDFAGETITPILDYTSGSYANMVGNNYFALRELLVKTFLNAVDSTCVMHNSPDVTLPTQAKMVILASPYFNAASTFDIDTLLSASRADIPVLKLGDALAPVVASIGKSKPSVAVLSQAASSEAPLWTELLAGADCIVPVLQTSAETAVADKEDLPEAAADSLTIDIPVVTAPAPALAPFLEACISTQTTAPLDLIIVADPRADAEVLRSELARLYTSPTQENQHLRAAVSANCVIASMSEILSDACYKLMRARNNFTHNISFPSASAYMTDGTTDNLHLTVFSKSSAPAGILQAISEGYPNTARFICTR